MVILTECVTPRPLRCRAKHREDFEKALDGLLNIIVQNTFSVDQTDRDKLKMSYFTRCIPKIHKFLVLSPDCGDECDRNRDAALTCLKETTKVPKQVLDDFIHIGELSMVLECSKASSYKKIYPDCSSGESDNLVFRAAVSSDKAPDVIEGNRALAECGPGAYLRKVAKRDLDEAERGNNHEKEKYILQPGKSPTADSTEECSPPFYEKYGKELKTCVKKRLKLKFRRIENKCNWMDVMETMTAMMECLIEGDVGMLRCQINTEEQLHKFLHHISKALKMDDVVTSGKCVLRQSCQDIALDMCTSSFFNLTKTSEGNSLVNILHGFYAVAQCFESEWPRCPPNYSTLSVSILLSALRKDYDLSVTKSSDFISCTVQDQITDEKFFKDCMSDDTYSNPFAVCQGCARQQSGICFFTDFLNMLQVVQQDIQRVSHCFKNFQMNEECINDFADRSKNSCLPIYYRFLEHLQNGRVVAMIVKLRQFNECITSVKKGCPEEFKYFIPEFYWDVLGVNKFIEVIRSLPNFFQPD